MFGILTWMILALTLMLCAFIVGIFLIIYGIKCHKSLTIIAGLLAIISGRQISSICSMGIILFLAGLCSVTGYHFLYLTL